MRGGGGGGRETQQPPGVCVPMGKAVCNKTHNRAKEEEAVVKVFLLRPLTLGCVLSGRGAFSHHPNASLLSSTCESAWLVFWWKRNQVISQNKMCRFPPPHTLAIRYHADVSTLTFRVVVFSRWDGDGATTHPEELSSVSAPRLLLLLPVCVFFKRLFVVVFFCPRRASCYIHESLCDRLPSLSALVSRRSHPGRFDGWRLNDPQEVVSAFTLPLAVPNVSVWQQV